MKRPSFRWIGMIVCLCLLTAMIAGCKPADSGSSTTTTNNSAVTTTTTSAGGDDTTTIDGSGAVSDSVTSTTSVNKPTNASDNNTTTAGKEAVGTDGESTTVTTPAKEVTPVDFPYKVLYNSDTTHVVNCVSPYNSARGAAVTAAKLDGSVKEAAEGGADAYSFTPGLCWIPWWPSEVFSAIDYITWFSNYFGASALTKNPYYTYAFKPSRGSWGTVAHDMIQEQIDSCRKYGVAAILSYRMNDAHYSNLESATYTPTIGYTSQVQVEHPEWKQTEGSAFEQTLFDYRFSEYREYRLAMIKELIANYDIDGFEMDFMRWFKNFTVNKTSSSGRLRVMVDFIGEIRAALDEAAAKDGKYRWLIAKIPAWTESHDAMGIDIKAWAEAGVDVFNLSASYYTVQNPEIAEIKAQAPDDVQIFYELCHAASVSDPNKSPDSVNQGNGIIRRTTVEQLYTTAYLAYEQGADGISLFNFQYYRGIPESVNDDRENKNLVNEPPFYALGNLGNKTFLAAQAQHYFFGRTSYKRTNEPNKQLFHTGWEMPTGFGAGVSATYEMPMVAPAGGWMQDGILRLWSELDLGDTVFEVKVNGVTLDLMATDPGEPYDSPYTTGLGTAAQRRCYTVPKSLLKSGKDNEIKVTQLSGDFTFISYLDLSIR